MGGASFLSILLHTAWLLNWPRLMQRFRTWPTTRRLSVLHLKRNALLAWCVLAAALFGLSLAVYWPILDGFFAIDDFIWLRAAQNADVPATVRRAFTFPTDTPFERPTPFWRPLIDLYFIAGWRVFGEHATAWHVSNLVLNAANASLLAAFSWRLTKSALVSALAALGTVKRPPAACVHQDPAPTLRYGLGPPRAKPGRAYLPQLRSYQVEVLRTFGALNQPQCLG